MTVLLTLTLTLTAAAADRHERRAHFVSAAADGTVLVWRLREPRPIARFHEHSAPVRALLQASPLPLTPSLTQTLPSPVPVPDPYPVPLPDPYPYH